MLNQFDSLLEKRVAEILQQMGFDFQHAPRIGGLQPDFLITGPNGATAILEVKGWVGDSDHLERAKRQAEGYREATGAEAALVVLSEAPSGEPESGVTGVEQLPSWLRYFGAEVDEAGVATIPHQRLEAVIESHRPTRTIFAAMPFAPRYDDVFLVAMSHAAAAVGATCVRVDKEDFTGDIVAEVRRLIETSEAVIADLSESRPNVLYEVGYAHALRRPTIPICSTPLAELPFDVGHDNTIQYEQGQTHRLRGTLAKRLQAALGA